MNAKEILTPIAETFGLNVLSDGKSASLFDGKTHVDLEFIDENGKVTVYFPKEYVKDVTQFIYNMMNHE